MKQLTSAVLVSALATALLAGGARAQINSPPPALMGQPSVHLYSVTGAIDSLGIGTFFSCTNTSSAPIRIGIELFAGGLGLVANDPSATSIEVAPGGTYFFGTGPAVGIPSAFDLGLFFAAFNGSARILATSKSGIICTAFLADTWNAPPTSMVQLTIVKKTKQKGD